MVYVSIQKDLTMVKTKFILDLSKRQTVCFGAAAVTGLPLFFLLRTVIPAGAAALLMIFVMLPWFLFAMYEKHGLPLEKYLRNVIAVIFIRPKIRTYQTNNLYAATGRQMELIKEVNGYARWATVYNLKQLAAALQYLQENNLLAYEDLEAKASEATGRYHDLSNKLKATEAAMKRNAELKAATVDYAKTRPIFEEYKAKKYSRKYLAEHEADITVYRAAQASMKEILQGAKLPKMDALKAEWQQLLTNRKSGYREYRTVQKDMREIVAVKGNIDHLLGLTDRDKNKEQER